MAMTLNTLCTSSGSFQKQKERIQKGRITLPRPNRDALFAIRMGKYTLAEMQEIGGVRPLAAQASSPLPNRVNRDAISRVVSDVHLRLWAAA